MTVYIEKSHPNIYAIMAILLPKYQYIINHDDKIPMPFVSQIDAKGFLFKAMEDPAHRKIMLKGYPVHQKVTPKDPDQASICDELGVRMC